MSLKKLTIKAVAAAFGLTATAAMALTCGTPTADGKMCNGTAFQYGGTFNPNVGESGGFGGASSCTATKTPVVFIHGNGDNATSWDVPSFQVPGYTKAPNSVYQEFKAAGYKDCELFGVTYLSSSERESPQLNYHTPSKYAIIKNFIEKVKTYTGKSQVDVITHSLGVTMAMSTMDYYGYWSNIRRFINIAGGLKGLDSCMYVGYANPYATTCGSQNWYNGWIYGFYPDGGSGLNPFTSEQVSMGNKFEAQWAPNAKFYTIYAGQKDEIMCATISNYSTCGNSPLLSTNYTNVKSQLNVGAGSSAQSVNWDWSSGWSANVMGGDTDGVGHFHARANTGKIQVNMLTTECTGTACAAGYTYGPVSLP